MPSCAAAVRGEDRPRPANFVREDALPLFYQALTARHRFLAQFCCTSTVILALTFNLCAESSGAGLVEPHPVREEGRAHQREHEPAGSVRASRLER